MKRIRLRTMAQLFSGLACIIFILGFSIKLLLNDSEIQFLLLTVNLPSLLEIIGNFLYFASAILITLAFITVVLILIANVVVCINCTAESGDKKEKNK